MAVRSDGIDTYETLLASAGQVFSDHGYEQATVAEICQLAGTNLAAVNYHFGSKAHLYAEVWRHALEQELESNPHGGGAPVDGSAEERLAGRITALVRRIASRGSVFSALLTRELVHRTAIFEEVRRRAVEPMHRSMNALIRELLGPDASDRDVLFTEMSVVNQCLGIGLQLANSQLHVTPEDPTDVHDPSELLDQSLNDDGAIEALARHIVTFSLAGVRGTRATTDEGAALTAGDAS